MEILTNNMINKSKNIGIITFHNTLNYGASLQAFALCGFLREKGFNAYIIDYGCDAIDKVYQNKIMENRGGLGHRIKITCKNFMSYSFSKKRKSSFNKFLGGYIYTQKYLRESISASNCLFDVFITGSDQVWNFDLTNCDTAYLLDFVKAGKKISYAASIGGGTLSEERKAYYLKWLSLFDYLSVRENRDAEMLSDLLRLKVSTVLDPTFLITKDQWKMQMCPIREKIRSNKGYILVYAQSRPVKCLSFANKIADGRTIIVVHGYAKKYRGVVNIRDASPNEFLNLLNCADLVITTSFHGVALSIILEKQFYYEKNLRNKMANDRIDYLVSSIGIDGRCINDEVLSGEKINYESVKLKLKTLRKQSIDFLMNALE